MEGSDFVTNNIKGHLAKMIALHLFEAVNYKVYPFGMESTFSSIKNELRNCTDNTSLIIRHMPDLFVSRKDGDKMLIEVKYTKKMNVWMNNMRFEDYQRYWGDAYCLYLTPNKETFYIQKISDIKPIKEEGYPEYRVFFDLENNFKPLMTLKSFEKIGSARLKKFKKLVENIDKAID